MGHPIGGFPELAQEKSKVRWQSAISVADAIVNVKNRARQAYPASRCFQHCIADLRLVKW